MASFSSSIIIRQLGTENAAELPDLLEHMFTVLTICAAINEIEKAYRQVRSFLGPFDESCMQLSHSNSSTPNLSQGMEQYLEFFWNYADVLLFVLLLAFIIMRNYEPWSSPIIVRNVLGLSAIPLYVRLLELLVLSRR